MLDIPTYFVTRDAALAFQVRPAGRPKARDPESSVEVDYIEVRVRYSVTP